MAPELQAPSPDSAARTPLFIVIHGGMYTAEGLGLGRIFEHSGTPLIRTPLGPFQVSCLVRCPDFRVKLYTNAVLGPARTVLCIEVSLFQSSALDNLVKAYRHYVWQSPI